MPKQPQAARANPKQPVRRNLDARREQNRIASRNYRQKRKQKLELLGQLLEPSDDVDVVQSQGGGIAGQLESPLPVPPGLIASSSASGGISPPAEASASNLTPASANFDGSYAAVFPVDAAEPSSSDESWLNLLGAGPPPYDGRTPDGQPAFVPCTNVTETKEIPHTPRSSKTNKDSLLLDVMRGVQDLSAQQKQHLLYYLHQQTDNTAPSNITGPSSSSTGPSQPIWFSSSPHPANSEAKTRLQVEALRFANFMRRNPASYEAGAGTLNLSRLYASDAGFWGAIFANCHALGMLNVEPMMDEDGVSIFSLGPDMGYQASQLGAVRPRFSSITTDLQPVDAQLTIGHHPYLDVLPFRTFRDRALRALQNDPPLLDEDELCGDLCSGLVCWGAQQNSLGMEAGVPWDLRSWEPKTWFLRKYWFLVGGRGDDMWRRARWWHNVRGERVREI